MPYVNGSFVNWTVLNSTQIISNFSNSTDVISQSINLVPANVQWFYSFILFALWIILFLIANHQPTVRFKYAGISALMLLVTFIMAFFGMITGSILGLTLSIFFVAFMVSFLAKL